MSLVVFEAAAVELVRSGLCDVVNDCSTCVPTVLCAVVVGDDLQLRDRILIAEEDLGTADGVVVVRLAIEFKVIKAAALSIDWRIGLRWNWRMSQRERFFRLHPESVR